MSVDYKLQANVTKCLQSMALSPTRKFTHASLKSRHNLDNVSARDAIDYLLKRGYIKEFWSKDFSDLDSKMEVSYQITATGEHYYQQLMREKYKQEQLEQRVSDYKYEQAQIKKSNRRWLIGCTVGFVVILAIAIIVALSLG